METRSGAEVAQVLRVLAKFAAGCMLIWLGLYELQNAFPYLQIGSDLIFQIKLRQECRPHLFKRPDAAGVLCFGNSKVLSGFQPDLFDTAMEAAGKRTESYNLGIPGYNPFVDRLESIVAAGNVPKYILITVPWMPDARPVNVFHFIRHDSQLMDELFPFRHLPRDMIMSASSSLGIGAPENSYALHRRKVTQMMADRGYFFIHDPWNFNGRLPANFKDDRDRPYQVFERTATTRDVEFKRLIRLLDRYQITCLLVPVYNRVGQMATPPPVDTRLQAELAPYARIRLLGPDYVLFENRYFSDQAHLNPDGARLYTRYLANLVAPYLR